MKPRFGFAFGLFALVLSSLGCGGGEGCDASVQQIPQEEYAGSYTAAFTPTGASAPAATFALTVDASGAVTGTATVPEGQTNVSGTATDIRFGCSVEDTGFDLRFPADATDARTLNVDKGRNGSLVGSYRGNLTGLGTTGSGTLVVAKVVTQD